MAEARNDAYSMVFIREFKRIKNIIQKNYEQSLLEGIMPTGLKSKKRPAFQPVLADFGLNWNNVLYDAEKKIVEITT